MQLQKRAARDSTADLKTILCIDDNEEGLAIRKLFLETFRYSVLTAASGREGLELLAANPVDAVILDYRMPDMTGDEVLQKARRIKPDVPILMLSGYPSAVPRELRQQADSFIVKGRPPTELLAEVDRLLGTQSRRSREGSNKAPNVLRTWETAVRKTEDRSFKDKRRHEEEHLRERRRAEEALYANEKLALAGRLSASVAHEINNPLESVSSLLHLLESEATFTPRGRRYLELAREELARVAGIARQTLDLHRETQRPVTVRLPELIGGLLELYQAKFKEKDLQVATRFAPRAEVQGFPGELRQVFSNLILNAVEAAGEGGRLCIHVSTGRHWRHPEVRGVLVSVGDAGPGIQPQHRRHLFQPFYTTKGEQGTGLGLWLTSRIVHKHGGIIKVRSSTRPGRSGAVFQVFLPSSASQAGNRTELSAA